MNYPEVSLATFVQRPNRFIAICQQGNQELTVHVKNTGKCRELLIPGVTVALTQNHNPARKTAFDLIAVNKAGNWINIDSQIPNDLAAEGLRAGQIVLPQVAPVQSVRREVVYANSRLDIAGELSDDSRFFVEVKGVTLERDGLAAFPDAVTTRGLKHVQTLMLAQQEGYHAFLLFIVQMSGMRKMTINTLLQPELTAAIATAQQAGVQVLAYDCVVAPESITLKQPVEFDLSAEY
ncbi:DNA/RNA nuclease SfsA [Lapidilactobacillus mulanensis]|uniref:Sugar fermentation stimulation protein homolog n=1 Tax=Lapidilactobacillus mulanensis TaxID=2485999 RepID=A0ABW4DPU4_9LACO|nr:DNA/RNA nuclease SfsA [Lapidilactobacillus mulanensis]